MRFQCKEYCQKWKKRHYIIIKGSKQLDRRLVRDIGTTTLSNNTIAQHHITGIYRALYAITNQYTSKCWGGPRETTTFIYHWWECKREDSLKDSHKIIFLSENTATVLFCIYPKELKTYIHKNLHADGCSCFIRNCQNLEATKMPFSSWMNKQTVVHLDNGILFSAKMKWIT